MQLVPAQLPLFPAPAPRRAVVVERLEVKQRRRERAARARLLGPVDFEVLLALPGRADALAERLGLTTRKVLGGLGQLAVRGLARRVRGSGASGVWTRV
jgi:hypothetical protein